MSVRERDLHAYLDGELGPVRVLEVEAELARDDALAAYASEIRAQKSMLHASFDGLLDEPLPHRLTRPVRPQPRRWQVAGICVSLAFGVASGWLLRDRMIEPQHVVLPRQAAIAHAAFSPEVRHPVEVAANEEAHLVAWLSKRLGARVRAPHLGRFGYELLGGRLLPESGRPGAQFMYQDAAGRRLTLYVSTDVTNRESAFRYSRENGLNVFYWIDQQLGYALSGDIDKQEMLRIARAVYEQLNP